MKVIPSLRTIKKSSPSLRAWKTPVLQKVVIAKGKAVLNVTYFKDVLGKVSKGYFCIALRTRCKSHSGTNLTTGGRSLLSKS